jgi:hypothetical protein
VIFLYMNTDIVLDVVKFLLSPSKMYNYEHDGLSAILSIVMYFVLGNVL